MEVTCILPKYKAELGPKHPSNIKHMAKARIESLYTIMGRDLVVVDSVIAGSIFAVKGLAGIVWRSATICAPNAGSSEVLVEDGLINLNWSGEKVSC